MNTAERISAQIVSNLSGDSNNLSSADNKDIISHSVGVCQSIPFSNYCSHTPNKPDFFQKPSHHKSRSHAIIGAIKRLEEAYFSPRKKLKSLQIKKSQVKSQRRNAAITLLQVMLYYVDDATGRVGRRLENGKFEDLSIFKLASYAKLRLKRAKRALADIVTAGYLFVTKQWTRAENGDIFALSSIKEFTPKFFIELDVSGDAWQKWFSLKSWKKSQLEKKSLKDVKKSQAIRGLIKETAKFVKKSGKNIMKKIGGIVKAAPRSFEKNHNLLQHEYKLRTTALELYKINPEISLIEYYKQLLKKYPLLV